MRHFAAAFVAFVCLVAAQGSALATKIINVNNNFEYPFGQSPADGDGHGCNLRKAIIELQGGTNFADCPSTTSGGSSPLNRITFSNANQIQMGEIGPFDFINTEIEMVGPKTIRANSGPLGGSEIFHLANGGKLILSGFTLTNARNSAVFMDLGSEFTATATSFINNTHGGAGGGAITGNGKLTIVDSTFTGNSAPSGSGGAINISGSGLSSITNTAFNTNSANQKGGAIFYTATGSVPPANSIALTNVAFTGNTAAAANGSGDGGGALFANTSGIATVIFADCVFTANTVTGNDGRGGAIYNNTSETVPMLVGHSNFLSNTASANAASMGGAIYSFGNIVVTQSAFIGNMAGPGRGGAFATNARPADSAVIPPTPGAVVGNSTFSQNTAARGGAVYTFGDFQPERAVYLINTTIDGNTATNTGGGIYTIGMAGTAVSHLTNTIVSNNSNGNCTGTSVENVASNLQFPGTTCAADTPITSADPKLNAPAPHAPDPFPSMSLKTGSAASSTGNQPACAAFPIFNMDQHSLAAPIRPMGGPSCDIGAYESGFSPGYASVPGPGATITLNTLSGVPASATITISETGTDDLVITGYALAVAGPQITISGAAAPFTIADGGGSQPLTATCSSPSPFSGSDTLTVTHSASGSPATYTIQCNVIDPLVITTASPLPAGATGVAYNQPLAATGGTAPYVNWAVTAGALPPGITLNAVTGVISGTNNTSGTFNFTVRVTDSAAATATKAFQLGILAPPLSITTASPLPSGTAGVAYSQGLAATGGVPPYVNWIVTAGALPASITLNATTGVISGTTASFGTFNFTVQVTDSAAVTATKAFQLVVAPPPLLITTASPLPGGTTNVAYSQAIAATGGTPPYVNWTITAGALPAGIAINATTGAITGSTATPGTFNFTVQVTDNAAVTATKAFALTIVAPTLSITTASPLPGGTANVAYSQALAATGGVPPYVNWTITAGALPAGITLDALTGVLSGTTVTPGTFNFTVQVTDNVAVTATKAFTLTIAAPALSITTASPLPVGTSNVAYSQPLAATGGVPPYVNWTITAGALPAGINIAAATGVISGTTAATGTFNFTVRVTDTAAVTATKAFQLVVGAAPPALSITTASPLPAGTLNVAYLQPLAATGGVPPYVSWLILSGALPAGITLDTTTGVIAGTSAAIGTFNFNVQVTDSTTVTATKAFALTIAPPTPSITTASPLPGGTTNVAYSQALAATGGTPPYVNWIVSAGALPAGITLDAATGLISGTTTTPGTFNFTAQVTDSAAATATKPFALTITAPPLSITTASPLPAATVNVAYSQGLAATGGVPPYVNWIVTAGALPAGITLNATTGLISGTTAANGTFNFTVQVTDSVAVTATKAFQLVVGLAPPALAITTASPLPGGTVNVAYAPLAFAATGGTMPYTNWVLSAGALPAGMTLAAASGTLTGTPATSGTFNFTVQVTDSVAGIATKAFALTIAAPPLSITTASPLPAGTVNIAYSQGLAATGGVPPYVNWIVTAGALPAGITLDATTGLISGTTAASGTFNFTAQVTDSAAVTATKPFQLVVGLAPPALAITTVSPLPGGTVNTAYAPLTFAATGGTMPYGNWIVSAGALPPGLVLTSGTGMLTGTPTAPGITNFTVQVMDQVGATASKAFAITIVAPPLSITTPSPLPAATVNIAYSQGLAAAGGVPPYVNWVVTAGALPAGIALDAATGVLSGTTAANGSFNFTAQVTDSVAVTATKAFQLVVGLAPPALSITTVSPLPSGTVNTAYPAMSFAATGGTMPYTNWVVTAGALPAGLTLAAATGMLSGTPTAAGSFNFTVQVTDSAAATATKAFALAIAGGPPTIATTSPLAPGAVGTAFNRTLVATGGTPPYSGWIVIAGALPPGLTLSAVNGIVSGTPTATGTFNFTVQVTDSLAATTTKAFAITIGAALPPPVITTTSPLPAGTVSTPYNQTFTASSGTPPYVNWALAAGSLPPGLALDAATGTLAGIPTLAGTFVFSIQVTDSVALTATQAFSVTIAAAPAGTPPTAIPTLSEWALILLALAFLAIGTVSTRRRT